jgi:hypothetical protein
LTNKFGRSVIIGISEPERSYPMYQRRTLALADDRRAELLYHRDHDPKP